MYILVRKYFLLIIFAFLALNSCRKDIDKPRWEANILTPVLKTSLSLRNLIKDSTFKVAPDSSVSVVYQQKLDSFSINVLDTFTASPFKKNVKLSSLQLVSDTIIQKITLADIARQLARSTNIFQSLIGGQLLESHGKVFNLPSFNNLSAGPVDLDINQWFKDATLLTGTLNVRLINNLPVDLTRIQFLVNNKNLTPKEVANMEFLNVASKASAYQSADLSGKKVEGNLQVTIPDIDIAGKTNVLIDTGAALVLEISIQNITVSEATAVFPAQNVVEDRVEVPLGNTDGLELKETILKSAKVKIEVYSTLDDTLFFSYKLPNAVSPSNVPFAVDEFVPPSTNSAEPAFSKVYDFTGYKLDLRGKPGKDTVNTFFSDLTGRIKQSLQPIYLSLNDSLDITITMSDIFPRYIKGYISKDTTIKGENKIDILKSFTGESISFEKAKVTLVVDNGFGITGSLLTKNISSVSKKGEVNQLEDPALVNVFKTIAPAMDNPFRSTVTTIGTENASNLLKDFPQQFNYEFLIRTDDGSAGAKNYNNFAYEGSYFKPSLNIEVPLAFSATGMQLSDTIDFDADFSTAIKDGTLSLIVENGFPINANLELIFLDNNGLFIDQLSTPTVISGALTNSTENKVTQSQKSKLVYNLPENKLLNIQKAGKIIFKVSFATNPEGKFVKLYSDYTMKFKIIGDITYKVQ